MQVLVWHEGENPFLFQSQKRVGLMLGYGDVYQQVQRWQVSSSWPHRRQLHVRQETELIQGLQTFWPCAIWLFPFHYSQALIHFYYQSTAQCKIRGKANLTLELKRTEGEQYDKDRVPTVKGIVTTVVTQHRRGPRGSRRSWRS